MPPHAYVSYSRPVEARTGVVAEIERLCAARKIELRRDDRQLDHGDSLPTFMLEIGNARWVFVVLSPEYLKSLYCMFEWLHVFGKGDLERRVLPVIVDREWLDDEKRNALIDELTAHWQRLMQQEADHAAKQARINAGAVKLANLRSQFAADINEHLAEWVQYFASHVLYPAWPLPSELLNKLVQRIPSFLTLKDDADYVSELKAEVARIVGDANVAGAFATALGSSSFAGGTVAEALLEDPERAIDEVLIPAYTAVRKQLGRGTASFDTAWEGARTLLAQVLMLSVRTDWIRTAGIDPSSDSVFDIAVQTAFGVEIVSARLRQFRRFELDASKGRADVIGKGAVVPPLDMPAGWGDGAAVNQDALRRVLGALWNRVFPEQAKQGFVNLSPTETRTLNDTLRKRASPRHHDPQHHYLLVAIADPDVAQRRLLCDELARRLPSLHIVRMRECDDDPGIFTGSETGLMVSAREFLSIPHSS